MNQAEFTEYANILLQEHKVEVFCEEGSVDVYSLTEVDDFIDTIFDLESSAIDIFKDDKNLGTIYFVMDNSKAKGVYVEINNSSTNKAVETLVRLADKYYQ